MDSQELSFYRRVRDGYLQWAEKHPTRFMLVDASRPLAQVQASIVEKIARFFDN